MDRFTRLYIFLSSLGLAVLPWLVLGTEGMGVLVSIFCGLWGIASIGCAILVDNHVDQERLYSESAIRMLTQSRQGILDDITNGHRIGSPFFHLGRDNCAFCGLPYGDEKAPANWSRK